MKTLSSHILIEIYHELFHAFGPRRWWPASSPFAVMAGAILTQNTTGDNARKAVAELQKLNILIPQKLLECPEEKLRQAIRVSGYYNQKSKKLRNLCRFLVERYEGDFQKMKSVPLKRLREELLAVNGIGPETADDILLYALNMLSFVIDRYTVRIFSRMGFVSEKASYETLKAVFEKSLPNDIMIYNEFHAVIDYLGHNNCKTKPVCETCPLADMCRYAQEKT